MALSLDRLIAALRAAAEPTRLRLLRICAGGELTVGEIARITGQSQPRISRHLKLLCDAGLLTRFREQHWVFYRMPPKGDGAELAHSILAMLAAEDRVTGLDQQRVEELQAERAEQASDYLSLIGEPWPLLGESGQRETEINRAIMEELDDDNIGDLLDIGTGTGRMLALLGELAEQAIGIDLSSEMRLVARTALRAAGLRHCIVRHANMYALPFADGSFDTVTMDQVLCQAEQPERVIAEAARILRPDGQLLLVDFMAEGEPEDGAGPRPLGEGSIRACLEGAAMSCDRFRRIPGPESLAWLCLAHRPADAGTIAA